MFKYLSRSARVALVAFLVIWVVALGWRYRNAEWIRQMLRPPEPVKQILFDNGSVRDARPTVDARASPPTLQQDNTPPGVMRKCVRGNEITYTDVPCPTGTQVSGLKQGNVTVVDRIAPVEKESGKQAQGNKSLMDALDLSGNENIKDKMIERAANR